MDDMLTNVVWRGRATFWNRQENGPRIMYDLTGFTMIVPTLYERELVCGS